MSHTLFPCLLTLSAVLIKASFGDLVVNTLQSVVGYTCVLSNIIRHHVMKLFYSICGKVGFFSSSQVVQYTVTMSINMFNSDLNFKWAHKLKTQKILKMLEKLYHIYKTVKLKLNDNYMTTSPMSYCMFAQVKKWLDSIGVISSPSTWETGVLTPTLPSPCTTLINLFG